LGSFRIRLVTKIVVLYLKEKKLTEANKVFKGGAFLFAGKMIQRSFGLISTLILARVLVPDDFGLVAIANLVYGFVSKSIQAGTGQYLIQKEVVEDTDINTSWTIHIILQLVIFVLLLIATPFVAEYYSDDRLKLVIPVLACMILAGLFGNPYLAILQRNQEYGIIFKIGIIKKVLSVVITVIAALTFQSYWALIIGHLVSSTTGTICSYVFLTYRPKFSLVNAKEQWGFSKWMLAKGILGYTRAQLDTFFVSSFYSPSFLGGFHISKYIASIPGSEGISPALEPLLATFSRTIKEKEAIQHQISLVIIVVFALAVPLSCYLFIFSEPFVLMLLGDKWADFASVFGILSLLTVPAAIGKVASQVITSSGKVKFLFVYDVYSLIFLATILFYVSSGTLEKFATARVLVEFLTISALFIVATHKIFGRLLFNILFLFVMYFSSSLALAFLTQYFFIESIPYFFSLAIVFVVFAVFSIMLCWLFFILFLRSNRAAHHVIFILKGVKNRCLATLRVIADKFLSS
jgi:lipopolysaccharide exporter